MFATQSLQACGRDVGCSAVSSHTSCWCQDSAQALDQSAVKKPVSNFEDFGLLYKHLLSSSTKIEEDALVDSFLQSADTDFAFPTESLSFSNGFNANDCAGDMLLSETAQYLATLLEEDELSSVAGPMQIHVQEPEVDLPAPSTPPPSGGSRDDVRSLYENMKHVLLADPNNLPRDLKTVPPTSLLSLVAFSAKKNGDVVIVKRCSIPGCNRVSRRRGLCKAHGAQKCGYPGCSRQSQGGRLCIQHGGGRRCKIPGCDKGAQSNSRCKAHGGGQRCQVDGCNKSSQGGGRCRAHGGGRRCQIVGCVKGAQRDGFCAAHGGFRVCRVAGCCKHDRGGGYCAKHGGGRRCATEDCPRPARKNGHCSNCQKPGFEDSSTCDETEYSYSVSSPASSQCDSVMQD